MWERHESSNFQTFDVFDVSSRTPRHAQGWAGEKGDRTTEVMRPNASRESHRSRGMEREYEK
jgi:hypothetical protein